MNVEVLEAKALTPHTEAVLAAGGKLLNESVDTGREFCKSMINISIAAAPAYVGLLKLFLPSDQLTSNVEGFFWLLPVALFVLSSAIFVFGYLPTRKLISLDLPDEVESAIEEQVSRRYRLSISGFGCMCLGIFSGVSIIVFI
jgi:NADH:ubiquinone oxidoreductase subunit 2 (subunit N)